MTDHYEELVLTAAGEEWARVREASETQDGGLLCRRDSQDTLTYLRPGKWRKVRSTAA